MERTNENDEVEDDGEISDGGEVIKATDVLSSATLEALLDYLKIPKADNNEICVEAFKQQEQNPYRQPLPLEVTDYSDALTVLKENGIVRINNILPPELCDVCLLAVNEKLAVAVQAGTDHFSEASQNGFGNIKPNEYRWDMFLDYSPPYSAALSSMLGETDSLLSRLFSELFSPLEAEFYEFGVVISDAGAKSQEIHPDTNWIELCPLYTMFIALQDISSSMGPTTFLPRTHTEEAHQHFHRRREIFLANSECRYGLLNKGDVAIMDSRLLHCGSGNSDSRRVVMYFTQLNPRYKSAFGGCTKFDYMRLPVQQIKEKSKQ